MDDSTWQAHHRLCPHCDLLVHIPALQPGTRARCPRCHTTLLACRSQLTQRITSYAIAALVMLVLANLYPFIYMNVKGIVSEITLHEIPRVMFAEHYEPLGLLFLAFVQIFPAVCLLLLLALLHLRCWPASGKAMAARLLFRLTEWGMPEIFLAGVLVSFVKLMAYGDIGVGMSFVPYLLFSLLQIGVFLFLDKGWLWNRILPLPALPGPVQEGRTGRLQGLRACPCCTAILPREQRRCPRCHTRGTVRRTQSLQWTLALLLTSLMLYIPANLLPIMITHFLGDTMGSTIMSGVILLWNDGSYPVALVIFIASIMVPTLKMVGIAWLCWDVKIRATADRERAHWVYEAIEFVGRWSMIDVFVIAILASLVRIGQMMNIYPAPGVILFALVVILTMFAAMAFDPRLIWDRISEVEEKELPANER